MKARLRASLEEALFARVREEAHAAREAAGDFAFATLMDRIHAWLLAERLIKTAAATEE